MLRVNIARAVLDFKLLLLGAVCLALLHLLQLLGFFIIEDSIEVHNGVCEFVESKETTLLVKCGSTPVHITNSKTIIAYLSKPDRNIACKVEETTLTHKRSISCEVQTND